MIPPQPLWLSISLALFAFLLSLTATPFIVRKLRERGRIAKDVNKEKGEAVEPGGIAPILAFYLTTMLLLAFTGPAPPLLATSLAMLAIAFLGLVDDILALPKYQKFIIPLLAAMPIVALKAVHSTTLYIPFVGAVDLGLLYLFLYVPLAFTTAANLTNILAGFNGMEAGMGIAMHLSMAAIGAITQQWIPMTLSLAYAAALLGFLPWNKYPAKAFPGDVMTMSTGALLAAEAITFNLDWAMAFLLIPFGIDALFKLRSGVPSKGWWGKLKGGKLHPLTEKPVGFAQFVMKLFNGIEEKKLSLFFTLLEVVAGVAAILFYAFIVG